MNLRQYSIALLISALPFFAIAQTHGISLDASDFKSAESITKNGEPIVKVKLSKSGKAKFKKLNELKTPNETVHSESAGVTNDFTSRAKIATNEVEMGPYHKADAIKVVTAINK